jgi:hypothetical protein
MMNITRPLRKSIDSRRGERVRVAFAKVFISVGLFWHMFLKVTEGYPDSRAEKIIFFLIAHGLLSLSSIFKKRWGMIIFIMSFSSLIFAVLPVLRKN